MDDYGDDGPDNDVVAGLFGTGPGADDAYDDVAADAYEDALDTAADALQLLDRAERLATLTGGRLPGAAHRDAVRSAATELDRVADRLRRTLRHTPEDVWDDAEQQAATGRPLTTPDAVALADVLGVVAVPLRLADVIASRTSRPARMVAVTTRTADAYRQRQASEFAARTKVTDPTCPEAPPGPGTARCAATTLMRAPRAPGHQHDGHPFPGVVPLLVAAPDRRA